MTDLDGTLMRDDKTISNESVVILNRLFSQGIFLTYATARSLSSASEITKSISFNLPVIIRNGTILADPQSRKEIEISKFGEELQHIRQALADVSIPGFATSYFGSNEVKLYLAGRTKVFRIICKAILRTGVSIWLIQKMNCMKGKPATLHLLVPKMNYSHFMNA